MARQNQSEKDQTNEETTQKQAAVAEQTMPKVQPSLGKNQNDPPRLLTIKEGYEAADYYSGKSSEINRQLALAGIAIIWVFKGDVAGELIVPITLVPAGLLLIIGLAVDLLHYVIAGEVWKRVTITNEQAGMAEFTVKPWVNKFGDVLYWVKIVATVIAYGFLIHFLANRLL